jgi:hypothetical protein
VARAGVKDEPQHRAAQRTGFQLEIVVGHWRKMLRLMLWVNDFATRRQIKCKKRQQNEEFCPPNSLTRILRIDANDF